MPDHTRIEAALRTSVKDVNRLRAENERLLAAPKEPIAIVGMGCRYPGRVASPEDLWRLVADGQDAIGAFPTDRGWDLDRLYDPDPDQPGTSYTREGGFLYDAGDFDAEFFGISPREALAMDPQQRLLLETAWETLEHANINPATLRATPTGVFTGIISARAGGAVPASLQGHVGIGYTPSVASGRVAYALGLEGPAVSIDTACSSSLVAIHLACQALRSSECNLALASGVTTLLSPAVFVEMARQRGLSVDGRCKAFSVGADGAGFSEGVGVLVLERLSDAQRNGREILGVIRGSAVNQDGASNGLTAPNGPSQERVIRQALANAGLSASEVDVVEGHGTGTPLGDPIEAQALLATYGQDRDRPLWLGSIKSNIGHSQAAAGVAGVIKMVMAMRHGVLPKTLHVDTPTTHVDWDAGAVELLTEEVAWEANGHPRRAGISSFGISGTNAHVIVEEAAAGVVGSEVDGGGGDTVVGDRVVLPVVPVVVSGRGARGLVGQAARVGAFMASESGVSVGDVGLSLAGRAVLGDRAVVVGDRAGVVAGLVALAAGSFAPGVSRGVARSGRLALMFTGQGSQRVGMGRELYATFRCFRDAFDAVCVELDQHLDGPLRDVILGVSGAEDAVTSVGMLDQTAFTQPALFALEVALFRLITRWGVRPDYLIGHSVGEIAAAHVAGVFSLEDAARLVAARGRLMGALPDGGAMVSLGASEADVLETLQECEGRVAVAAVNGPASVVISGDEGAVLELQAQWHARGVKAKRLVVSHAFHSPLMDGMLDEFRRVVETVEFAEPRIPIVSNVTGVPVTADEVCAAEYWVRHVREPVRFMDGVHWLAANDVHNFVELGPDGVLSAMGQSCVEDLSAESLDSSEGPRAAMVAVLRGDREETGTLFSALAEVWVRGVGVDWAVVFEGSGAQRVALPTYAFQRQRYWLEGQAGGGDARSVGLVAVGHPLLGAVVGVAGGEGLLFTGRLSLASHGWLADHAVMGAVLLPGTAFLELVMHAGGEAGWPVVRELVLEAPLVLAEQGAVQLQVAVGDPDEDGHRSVSVFSRAQNSGEEDAGGAQEAWTRHASGTLAPAENDSELDGALADVGGAWPPPDAIAVDAEDVYDRLAEHGLEYGPAFQGLQAAWRRGTDLFAEIHLPEQLAAQAASYDLHPALLDAALHTCALTSDLEQDPDAVHLPFAWSDVTLGTLGASTLRVRLTQATHAGDGALSLLATDETGRLVLSVGGLLTRAISAEQLANARAPRQDSLFTIQWAPLPTPPQTPTTPSDWAILTTDSQLVQTLKTTGLNLTTYPDLDTLTHTLDQGLTPPDVVLLDTAETTNSTTVPEDTHTATSAILATLQQWLTTTTLQTSRLAILTHNAIPARPGDPTNNLAASAIWGLVRSAQSENPDTFTLLDLDNHPNTPTALPTALQTNEPQLATREGTHHAPRLTRPSADGTLNIPDNATAWRLELDGTGTFESLRLTDFPDADKPLREGEVRIEVRAAGLNFRDVVTTLGLVPLRGDWDAVGSEGAGVVLDVGPGVEDLERGDRVMGLLPGAFGSVAIADRRMIAPIPSDWSFVEAASVPAAFLTAYYGLVDLAGLRSGERVLVHAAAGGVGMAAVQLSKHLGAEVFATANPRKWVAVGHLGVEDTHISSSRDLEFGARFREVTADEGIDVVINSLAGEYVDASLALLRQGGRFLEMGKTDIRDPARVVDDHPGLTYHAFDLSEAGLSRIQEILREILRLFETGALGSLPIRAWDLRWAPEAFRFMSQGRHTGKVVLTLPPPALDAGGTVLITGGTGMLGGHLARHLVRVHGVRSLVLASRRGPDAPGAAALEAELSNLGANVRLIQCDVADRDAVERLVASVPSEHPLVAVVHAAGVTDDGVIASLDPERLRRVMAPKVNAAWHLHELTVGLDLSMFVLFSSAASALGAPGQASYAAANAFLDELATYRRAHGLPATSIAWGLWNSASDMTGELTEADLARIKRAGFDALLVEEGLELFDASLRSGEPLTVSARLNDAALRAGGRAGTLPPLLSGLAGPHARRTRSARGSLAKRLRTLPDDERPPVVLDLVRSEVATVLGHTSPNAIDPDRAFKDLGFDSLAAVELRNRLNTITGLRLPATLVFDHPTTTQIARHLLTQIAGIQPRHATPTIARAALDEPIAIVGMGCRYPGRVASPEDLWRLVADGQDAIGAFPTDRGWDLDRLYDPDPDQPGTSYTREGGFLYDAGDFDAEFFGISPREALAMDPQQRLLLETAWETLEHANINPATLRATPTGVFTGTSSIDYGSALHLVPDELEGYIGTGISASITSGRIAYTLGLEGPAVSLDTACSSSLVAIHLACQALRSSECDLALASGVTIMASPGAFVLFSRQRALAVNGRCKSFSDAADGTAWSEGVGLVLLERLSDAQRNGREILGVIRGSAVNQDGASNGLTAPNGPSQERVIRQALANAGLSASEVDVVEGHGTGTPLGDPIEAQALLATYGQDRDRPLWLGSIKSNIGHSQAAAGVAGVIKMVMAMRHGVLPKTLHVDTPTTHVDWDAGAVELLTEEVAWEANGHPRRAGISSFGISGTNAHVILEEAVDVGHSTAAAGALSPSERATATTDPDTAGLLPWIVSAKSQDALREQAARLLEFVRDSGPLATLDIGFSLTRRSPLAQRAVVVGNDQAELLEGLQCLADSRPSPRVIHRLASPAGRAVAFLFTGQGAQRAGMGRGVARSGRLALMFTGQGSQRVGMGRELYATFRCFRDAFDAVCVELDQHLDGPLRDVILGVSGAEDAVTSVGMLDQTAFTQPALFALEVALFRLITRWGVRPDYLIGHSVGEIAAAHVAGVFSLEDAARLVAARGRLMGALPDGGAMVSLGASEADVLETLQECEGRVAVAAVNGPASVVISGDEGAVLELQAQWHARGVKAKRLVVSHAFHSPLMDGMLDEFRRVVETVEFAEPRIPIVSNVTGVPVTADEVCAAEYWVRHVREPVRFMDGVHWLAANDVHNFVELGPDGVLSAMGQSCVEDLSAESLDSSEGPRAAMVAVLRGDREETGTLFSALAEVWVRGVGVDWAVVFEGSGAQRVALPTYAFQRQRYWLEGQAGGGDARSVGLVAVGHPLLGAVVGVAGGEGLLFTGRLSLASHGWLADHAVMGAVLLPGTAFLELVMHAGGEAGWPVVRELVLEAPLVLAEQGAVQLQVAVGDPDEDGHRSVSVFSRAQNSGEEDAGGAQEAWTRHASGTLAPAENDSELDGALADVGGAWPPPDAIAVDAEDVYDRLAEHGLEYGPAFQGLQAAWRRGTDLFAEIHLPEQLAAQAASYDLHPALLDAALHTCALTSDLEQDPDAVHLPFAWSDVTLGTLGASTLRVRLTQATHAGDGALSLLATDETGRLVLSVGGLLTRAISAEQLANARAPRQDSLFTIQWAPLPTPPQTPTTPSDWAILTTDSQLVQTLKTTGLNLTTYPDLDTLTHTLDQGLTPPDVVLLDTAETTNSTTVPEDTHTATSAILATLQQWLTTTTLQTSRLAILTHNAIPARPGDPTNNLAASAIWGLVRSAQSENPDTFTLLDLDNHPNTPTALPTALQTNEPQLATREGTHHAPRLTPITPPTSDDQPAEDDSPPVAGGQGTVLITGGTGGLGALLARHLVERGAKSLLLASRQGPDAPGAAELQRDLESLGALVQITACDVTDRGELTELLTQVPDEFPLRGVVHAAGVIDDGVISSLDPERLQRVMAPKVNAAWHLHELTKDIDLSMFVLFSSAAATLGSPGQGNYSAANTFLDTLAAHRRSHGQPATSIAWGYWAQHTAMTSQLADSDLARMTRAGILPLTAEEGLRLFDTAHQTSDPHIVAVHWDTPTLRAGARAGLLPALLENIVQLRTTRTTDTGFLTRRLANVPATEHETVLTDLVRSEVATVLGHTSPNAIDPDRAFKDLGFDSLAAVELRNRLNTITGLRLPATLVFDHPTTTQIARHLLTQIGPSKSDSLALDRRVDALDQFVNTAPMDHATRVRVAARLQALLATLDDTGAAHDAAADEAELRAATDAELLALIDDELGVS